MSIRHYAHDGRKGSVGLGVGIVSAATFGTAGTFAGSLMATGWTPSAVVTFRISIAALLLTVPAVRQLRSGPAALIRHHRALLLFGVVAVGGCQVAYFNAVQHLSVGVALLLEYSGVVLVVGWLWLRRGQRPGRLTSLGVMCAVGGLALVLNPAAGTKLDPVGVLWGLVAAAGLAVYFVVGSSISDDVPPLATAWAGLTVGAASLIACDLLGVVSFRTATADVRLGGREISWLVPLLGVSMVAAAVAYATGVTAARMLGARVAAMLGLTEVLFAIGLAWALLAQAPRYGQAIGAAVVLAGIALVHTAEPRQSSEPTGGVASAGRLRSRSSSRGGFRRTTPAMCTSDPEMR